MEINIYKIKGITSKKVQTIKMNKEMELDESNKLVFSEEIINDFGDVKNFEKILIQFFKESDKDILQKIISVLYRKHIKENKISTYIVYGNDEIELNKLINIGIKKIENFQVDFKAKYKIEDYIFLIDCIIFRFGILNGEFENKELQHFKGEINEKKQCAEDEEEKVSYIRGVISEMIMTYSQKFNNMSFEDGEQYISNLSELQDYLEEETQQEYTESISTYYKNVLKEEAIEEFENMTELIKNELINYETNIVYCEKIINFITEEFSENGVFPMDLIFIKQFVYNATAQMILSTTKLYHDKPNMTAKRNFGFTYLRTFIRKNIIDINNLGQEINSMLASFEQLKKEVIKISEHMQSIRDSLIAHYDIDMEKIEEIKKIKIELETFKLVYKNSVKIFETLSLYRYHRDSRYIRMIKKNGFEKTVCTNMLIHNPNLMARLDIENYLDLLRKNFRNNLKIKKC